MHVERMQQLRDHLAQTPDERFNYGMSLGPQGWPGLSPSLQVTSFLERLPYPCGSMGCVAGHACLLFDLHADEHMVQDYSRDRLLSCLVLRVAANHLELSEPQRHFLFLEDCTRADRSDAVRRLDHLLQGGKVETYDWAQESWAREDRTRR